MGTQLPSGIDLRVLRLLLACFLLILAIPASAMAQAPTPAWTEVKCTVESIQTGGGIAWTIKGEATSTNLPGSAIVDLKFLFSKKLKGAAGFVPFAEINQTTSAGAGGTKTFSTSPTTAGAPNPGDQYKFEVSGQYTFGPPPPQTKTFATKDSNIVTPIP